MRRVLRLGLRSPLALADALLLAACPFIPYHRSFLPRLGTTLVNVHPLIASFAHPSPHTVPSSPHPSPSPHRNLDDLGAKARVMELMGHADPDVKYFGLVATQRLISHAWAA